MLGTVRHLARLTASAVYREEWRLRNLPPRQPGVTSLLGRPFRFHDGRSCFLQHRLIIKGRIYSFHASTETPVILDCGANIGMATAYFKRLYPGAHVLAFEADPHIHGILSENIRLFEWEGVSALHAAVSHQAGTLHFACDGRDGGRVCGAATGAIVVPAVRLRDCLPEAVDFLKLDIEGAETDALLDCGDALRRVEHLFAEYHGSSRTPQMLPELLRFLKDTGFRTYIQSDFCPPRPLEHVEVDGDLDLRLNIFGRRIKA